MYLQRWSGFTSPSPDNTGTSSSWAARNLWLPGRGFGCSAWDGYGRLCGGTVVRDCGLRWVVFRVGCEMGPQLEGGGPAFHGLEGGV